MDSTIGPYRITGLIGQGGMGAVYAAEHTLLGRPAAIKVLHGEMSQKQDVVMRFFNEARAATAIRHPGIVEIYDFGWTPANVAYIVMEHLQGESLSARASKARLAMPQVLAIARQIAGALAAAHAKGIVHRDLKPDNIFLVPDPEVPGGERIKLLDFGIAKLAGETATLNNVTRTGSVMGTPTYMAPEQCRGVAVDHRVDLYALGCIVFELCCGRAPFVGEGAGDVLAAHIHVPVPTMASLGAQVPPAVEALVQHLLAKPVAERVQTAEALIHAIDRAAAERAQSSTGPQVALRPRMQTGAAPPAAATDVTTLSGAASATTMPARNGRRRALLAASATGAVALAAVVMIAMRGAAPTRAGSHVDVTKLAPSEANQAAAEPEAKPVEVKPAAAAPQPVEATAAAKPAPVAAEPAAVDDAVATKPAVDAKPAPAVATEPAVDAKPAPAVATEIQIDSVPPGAMVLLGGELLGKTPLRTSVTHAGDATLIVRLAGYADRSLAFRAGHALDERVTLVKPKRAAPPARSNRDQSVNPFGQ